MRKSFVAIALAGLVLLWGTMFFNGTLDALSHATADKILPSGRKLMSCFTGIPFLDNGIATLIAFFDGISNGSSLSSSLLLWDLLCVVHCLTIWIMVDGFNLREEDPFIRAPTLWVIAGNTIGWAIVLPIYCLVRMSAPYPQSGGLSIGDGYGLIFSASAAFIPTLLMTAPPFISWSRVAQQSMILSFLASPLLFNGLQRAAGAFINQFQYRRETSAGSKNSVLAVYAGAATVASLGHAYVFVRALFSGGLAQVFIPNPSKLDSFPADRLTAGAHLFSQYDYLLVAATCFLYVYLELAPHLDSDLASSGIYAKSTLLIAAASSTVLLGPGATLMLGLWARNKYITDDKSTIGEKMQL